MKKYFVLSFLIILLVCINTYSQPPVYWYMFDWETRYTPTGEAISAGVLDPDYELTDTQKEDSKDYWLWYYNYRIQFKGEATRSYNCHGYAWHVSEGGDNVWINTPNDDKYWTEGTYDASYKEISSQTNAKVAFVESADHSAIRTSSANIFISKWGQAPKFQHDIDDCPYEPKTNLKYYTLDPKMTGIESILCYNEEREFKTNITHMTEATLTWTKGSDLTYVSGAGTPEYIVKGQVGGGYSYVNFQITTPSGFSWSNQKNFFVGTPYVNPATIEFTCVEGPGYFCTNAFGNEYTFTYTGPYNYFDVKLTNLSEKQTLWQEQIYYIWSTVEYWPPEGTYKFMVRGNNACGTAPNWSKTTVDYVDCGWWEFLIIVPNPAINEITMELKTDNIDTFTEGDTWEAEIFNQQMQLIHKTARLKDKTYTINVSGWKEGVYYVRAKVKDKLLSGKFIISR